MLENSPVKRYVDKVFLAIGESSWLLLCFVAVLVLFGLALQNTPESWQGFAGSTLGQLASTVLIYAVAGMLVVTPLLVVRGRAEVMSTLGLERWPRIRELLLAVPVWLMYMVATVIAGVIASLTMPWIDPQQAQEVGFGDIDTVLEYVMAFVALVVLPPIAEELMFRGYLFGRLRTRLGFVATSLIVSLLFGLVHQQWNVAIDTFVLSLFLCYLRERTGSVWPSVLLHMLKNGFAYLLLFIAPLLGFNLLQ